MGAEHSPEESAAQLAKTSGYALPPSVMANGYQTKLGLLQEMGFQIWVKENNVPFDPSPTSDYDMRGFYQAQQAGDPVAQTGMNENDGKLHFTDHFKTPFHESFSNLSKYAGPGAPSWNAQDQLVMPDGKIVLDERNPVKRYK